jgi:bacterioferritin
MQGSGLLDALNRAVSDEWLAFYQYWIGAQIAAGPIESRTTEEFLQHARDEYGHATTIAHRIVELKGSLPMTPRQWWLNHFCGYIMPTSPLTLDLLKQNISAESCAIGFYESLSDQIVTLDPITWEMLQPIYEKEKEHKRDLMDIREAVQALMPRESDGKDMGEHGS